MHVLNTLCIAFAHLPTSIFTWYTGIPVVYTEVASRLSQLDRGWARASSSQLAEEQTLKNIYQAIWLYLAIQLYLYGLGCYYHLKLNNATGTQMYG